MNKLELLRTFVRVSELSSFTLAGEDLGLPRSTVSEHVRALEALLGTRLLQRTTRKVQATQDGLVLYERSKDLLSHMDEIEGLFHQDEASLSGRIRIDLPNILARQVVMPCLPAFMARHPNLELEISSTDRRVDLLGEGFDCVLRVGAQPDQTVVARHLCDFVMVNCASPDYLERYGMPQSLEDLAQHRLVHYVGALGSRSEGFCLRGRRADTAGADGRQRDGEQYRRLRSGVPGRIRPDSGAALGKAGATGSWRTGASVAAVQCPGAGGIAAVRPAKAFAATGAGIHGLAD
jgi:DNA-binding transcriptional LysR family regulator